MKEENVYLKKLDRIARVSAFQKSNPEAHIEGAFTKYYKVIDITLTRILKPGILKFILNNFLMSGSVSKQFCPFIPGPLRTGHN